jgi:hypothetical protein
MQGKTGRPTEANAVGCGSDEIVRPLVEELHAAPAMPWMPIAP